MRLTRGLSIITMVVLLLSAIPQTASAKEYYCFVALQNCRNGCFQFFGGEPLYLVCEVGCFIGFERCGA